MKKAIVTTTINQPTKALAKFLQICKTDDWHMFIVGDKKTPHMAYQEMEMKTDGRVRYISPEMQEKISQELSDLIGWNCIQRRNFGLIVAYNWGADIIATIDDDNIPKENWGKRLAVGTRYSVDYYETEQEIFDPLAATIQGGNIWHRGFPVELIPKKNQIKQVEAKPLDVKVQADLWDGDPDIDAICRIAKRPLVKFDNKNFYAGNKPAPFNSQNTFLHRSVFPDYFLWPHIGRMDDIWAAYYIQAKYPDSVVFGPATVYQDRNEHNLVKDLKAEMIGYEHSLDFNRWCQAGGKWEDIEFLPFETVKAFRVYQKLFNQNGTI